MVMEKESVTIRFPSELMRQAKRLKSGKESFNELVVEAVEREVRRRKNLTKLAKKLLTHGKT